VLCSTWSSRGGEGGWPSSSGGGGEVHDDGNKGGGGPSEAWQTDLVPEFEPGKPWKGTQILKSVDDDPTLTPGSVVRSPLSLAVIKDATEIFAKGSSASTASAGGGAVSSLASDSLPLSLSSSSTWSYTPTSASAGIAK